MRTQAAVLYEAGTDWKVEDIELDSPRTGEVLVRVAAAGLCHSEEHHRTGDMPFAAPMIGGHEGAGFVEAVGPGVTLVRPGDYIVFSSVPNCGRCPSCAQGRQNLCDIAAGIMAGVQILDGSSRHRNLAGRDLTITCMVGCYARHTVVNEASEIYYHGQYWNDLPAVQRYMSECFTGDPDKSWTHDFLERYCQRPFSSALFLNCGNGWVGSASSIATPPPSKNSGITSADGCCGVTPTTTVWAPS